MLSSRQAFQKMSNFDAFEIKKKKLQKISKKALTCIGVNDILIVLSTKKAVMIFEN
jgi:hypothetical protein